MSLKTPYSEIWNRGDVHKLEPYLGESKSNIGNRGWFRFLDALLSKHQGYPFWLLCWSYRWLFFTKKEDLRRNLKKSFPVQVIEYYFRFNRGGTQMEFSIVAIGLEFLSEYKQGASFLRFRLKMHACRWFLMQWMIQFGTILLLADENRSLRLRADSGCHFDWF